MKKFDLEAAKNGAQVQTREGNDVTILYFERKHKYKHSPIVALVGFGSVEEVITFRENGKFKLKQDSKYDLFMKSVKKEGWINVYKSNNRIILSATPRKTRGETIGNIIDAKNLIDTIKIEWEE